MLSANKAFWKDISDFQKQRCSVKDSVKDWWTTSDAVFAFGSENWSWTMQTMEKIKGWETKKMTRLFRF